MSGRSIRNEYVARWLVFERRGHGVELGQLDRHRGVGAVVAQLGAPGHPDALGRDVLVEQFGARGRLQVVGDLGQPLACAPASSGASTDCSRIAVVSARPMPSADSTPAIGGTSTVRMPSESATAHACWPPAPPKVVSTYSGDVVALLDGDPLDRVGHVGHRDPQEALGDLLGRAVVAGLPRMLGGQVGEPAPHDVGVERLVAARAEHVREVGGLDAAEHHVGVGDGERAAAAVAGRARVGAGRVRPDPVAAAVEVQDRAAAGGDRVDVEHGGAQPDPGHLGVNTRSYSPA